MSTLASITRLFRKPQQGAPSIPTSGEEWRDRAFNGQMSLIRACLEPTIRLRTWNPSATQALADLCGNLMLLKQLTARDMGRTDLYWPTSQIEALLDQGADPNAVDLVDLMGFAHLHRAYTPKDPEGLYRILAAVIRAGHVFTSSEQSELQSALCLVQWSGDECAEQLASIHNAKIEAEGIAAAMAASTPQALPSTRRRL